MICDSFQVPYFYIYFPFLILLFGYYFVVVNAFVEIESLPIAWTDVLYLKKRIHGPKCVRKTVEKSNIEIYNIYYKWSSFENPKCTLF